MIGEDGLCRCDALPEPHVPGTVDVDTGATCETAFTGRTISPHLFGAEPPGEPLTG